MAKVDKKTIILECVISEYIKTAAPVGSERLQSIMDMEISSATIRNYFKQMVEEGVLVQFHISGGRVPSALALRQFWIDRLSSQESVEISDMQSVAEAAKKFKISSILIINESDKLLGSYMAGSKFVVAEFEKGEVLLRGDAHTKAFLDEFVGLEASQIKDLAARYNASEIFLKLSEYLLSKDTHISNKEELLEIAKSDDDWAREKMSWFLDGTAALQVGRGIYFKNLIPEGFMAVKTDAKVGGKSAEMLYVGHLSRNFDGFLCALN